MRPTCRILIFVACCLACHALRADEADDQFAVAAAHYSAGRWDLAAEEFRELLTRHAAHPRAAEARFFLAETYVQQAQWEQARTLFGEVLADAKLSAEQHRQALFRHGEAALFAGDDATARRQLESFLKEDAKDEPSPQAAYALPYLAEILQRKGDPAAARRCYEQCLRQFDEGPLTGECRLGLADLDRQAGKLESAIAQLKQLTHHQDTDIACRALFALGETYNRSGQFPPAADAFSKIIDDYPQHHLAAHATLALAWSLYKQDKFTAARESLQRLLDDSTPDDQTDVLAEARYWLGIVQLAEKSYAEASQAFAEAGPALPDRLKPAALFQQGQAQLLNDQPAAAVESFDRLLEQFPDDAYADDALFGKLQAAIKQAQHQSAIELAERLATDFPSGPLCATGECDAALAVCHARLGQWQPCRTALAELSKRNCPALYCATQYGVAEIALHAGELEFAATQFHDLATATTDAATTRKIDAPSDNWAPRALLGLALVRSQQAKRAESIETLEKLLKAWPDHEVAPVAGIVLAEQLEQSERYDAALLAYQRVNQAFAQSAQAPVALLRAAALHAKLHQFAEAAALYEKFIEQHPQHADLPQALLNWGNMAMRQGEPQTAQQRWQQLLEKHPTTLPAAEALYQLALQAGEARDFAASDAYLQQLAKHPAFALLAENEEPKANSPTADLTARRLYLAARLAAAQEEWTEVSPLLKELLALHPQHELALPAQFWLAEASYRRSEFESAASQFASVGEALRGRDASLAAKAQLRYAQALAQQNKWNEAREAAEAIHKDYADFAEQHEVDYLIGRCFANEAEFARAREAYQRVIRSPTAGKTETAAMAQFMTAETYFHAEDYAAALKAYLRVEILYAFPAWQAAALLQAGKCNEQLNQWQPAAENYSRLLRVYPNSVVAEEAAQRLGVAQQRVAAKPRTNKTTPRTEN